jgi:hypothetical protein
MLAQADNSNNSSNSDRSEQVNAILDTGMTGGFLADTDQGTFGDQFGDEMNLLDRINELDLGSDIDQISKKEELKLIGEMIALSQISEEAGSQDSIEMETKKATKLRNRQEAALARRQAR